MEFEAISTEPTLEHLDAACRFIRSRDPKAGQDFETEARGMTGLLAKSPYLGAVSEGSGRNRPREIL